jgi:flagellar hook-associated protein 1 FlgK
MASSFMGLYVQREALVAAQKALDITGNNLSNITTDGYSRQRVDVCSVGNIGYNLMYNTSVSLAGQGVDVVGVAQYRDALVDDKVRNYTTLYNEYNLKDTVMKDVETALDNIESDSYGFASNLADFKAALQSYSADDANRKEIANVAFRAGESVVQQVQYMNSRLDDISKQTLTDAQLSVDTVNSLLQNMANLNKQITNSYIQMGYIGMSACNYQVDNDYGPLELKDSMNSLIDQLSQYGDVKVVEHETNGSYEISFAGQLVVYNDQYAQIAMTEENPEPFDMAFKVTSAGKYDSDEDSYSGLMNAEMWEKLENRYGMTSEEMVRADGGAVDITSTGLLTSGSLRGYLDVYNGDGIYADEDGNSYEGIEYYRDLLNSLTVTMTNAFNDIYKDYTDENGEPLRLFTYGDTAYYQKEEITEAEAANVDPDSLITVQNDDGTTSYYKKTQLEDSKTAKELYAEMKAADPDSVTTGKDADGNTVYYERTAAIDEAAYNAAIAADPDSAEKVDDGTGNVKYYSLQKIEDEPEETAADKYAALKAANKDVYAADSEGDFRTAAAKVTVTNTWRNNPTLLAQPEQYTNGEEDEMDELNNDFIHKCLAIFENSSLSYANGTDGRGDPNKMTLEKFVAHISDTLGTKINSNTKLLETTDIMLDSVTDARDEIMGVSVDEEGINMMNYQKWYNAIARMVTTLDEALDKIINGMGIVGL